MPIVIYSGVLLGRVNTFFRLTVRRWPGWRLMLNPMTPGGQLTRATAASRGCCSWSTHGKWEVFALFAIRVASALGGEQISRAISQALARLETVTL